MNWPIADAPDGGWRAIPRDTLMALLWPDQDSDTAGHRLSQMLYSLRQTMGGECIQARGRDVLAGTRLEADAPEFERAVDEGDFAAAVALYGGPFLAGVYLAREPALERLVAVKVLSPRFSADDVARRRFEREARSAARIVHANVAQIYRLSMLEGKLPFIVMDFVDGRSVADILAGCGVFDPLAAWSVVAAVADALAAAHDHGIIHRDVSPGNIFIENRTRRPVLTDFGIAGLLDSGDRDVSRLTPAGYRVGNNRYMSPELARGESVTDVSDVYALGVVAFEMLTGEHPFGSVTPGQMIVAHIRREPRPLRSLIPHIPHDLADLVERCLSKVPGHRPRACDVAAMLAQSG